MSRRSEKFDAIDSQELVEAVAYLARTLNLPSLQEAVDTEPDRPSVLKRSTSSSTP